ncbi:recombinase family protein [Dysosmobacter sp.]|uniref:recombinase family protein n=1 Tax=Dysosmobacter sp. TaxID=2591382 RepID=UPI00307C1741
MGNRKLPFGYQMRMGEIVRNEPEAKAVQDIFLQYTLGASLKKIAEQMSKTGPTYDDGKSWNKNMIARILENTKYTGTADYPSLVDAALFEAASAKRQTKQRLPERTPAQKVLKRVCSKLPTPDIEQQITHLLGKLAEQPERIMQPDKQPTPIHSTTQAELDEILNTQPLDEAAARSLICKLAQEQYDAIGNEEYETERLRRLFTAFECTAELNAELLQSTVSAVLVTQQAVRLQLKNGQIIGKEDLA